MQHFGLQYNIASSPIFPQNSQNEHIRAEIVLRKIGHSNNKKQLVYIPTSRADFHSLVLMGFTQAVNAGVSQSFMLFKQQWKLISLAHPTKGVHIVLVSTSLMYSIITYMQSSHFKPSMEYTRLKHKYLACFPIHAHQNKSGDCSVTCSCLLLSTGQNSLLCSETQ